MSTSLGHAFEQANNTLDRITGGFTTEAMILAFIFLVILAFAPIIIAIARGRRDLGPDSFALRLMGFLACCSGLLMPLGLYFFYANYERTLTA